MLDSIKINLYEKETQYLFNQLNNVGEYFDKNTGLISYTGKLNNFKIWENSGRITINGSLAKFYMGNNVEFMTRKKVKEAFEKLEDLSGLKVNNGYIRRFDFGNCLVLNQPVREYLGFLGYCPYFNKTSYSNGNLLYANDRRALSFYDKTLEMKKNKNDLPEGFGNRYLLKYELRYLKRITEQFKYKLKVIDLIGNDFYIWLIKTWQKEYFRIKRNHRFKMNLKNLNTKDFTNQFALFGFVEYGGKEAVLQMLEIERQSENIDRFQFKRLKDKLEAITSNKQYIEPNDCIKELDEKISDVEKYSF